MLRSIAAALFATLPLILTSARAAEGEPRYYADFGYAHVTFLTEETFGFDTTANSLISHLGANLSDYFAVEAEIGIVSMPEEEELNGLSAKIETTVTLGAYAKAQYPVTDFLTVYARLGAVYAEAETTIGFMGVEATTEDEFSGYSYGVGGIFDVTPKNGIRVDYNRFDLDEIEADVFILAYLRRF